MEISFTNAFARAGLLRTFTQFDPHTATIAPTDTNDESPTFAFGYGDVGGGGYRQYTDPHAPAIRLMKGTMPTHDSEFPADYGAGAPNTLVSWSNHNEAGTWVANPDGTPDIYLSATNLAYAAQSGTATWIWWHTNDSQGFTAQAAFSVGLFGSGSDFELPNTSIVYGQGYKLVNGPKLSFNTTFTY